MPNFYHGPATFFTIIDIPIQGYVVGRKLQGGPMQLTGVDWVPSRDTPVQRVSKGYNVEVMLV